MKIILKELDVAKQLAPPKNATDQRLDCFISIDESKTTPWANSKPDSNFVAFFNICRPVFLVGMY
jgi:hypothetical protein